MPFVSVVIPLNFWTFTVVTDSQKATHGCYSTVLPLYFAHVLLLVYAKKQELTEAVQAGYRAILKDLEDQLGQESDLKKVGSTGNAVDGVKIGRSGSMGVVVPTPPATPMSKLHSRNASLTMRGKVQTLRPFRITTLWRWHVLQALWTRKRQLRCRQW